MRQRYDTITFDVGYTLVDMESFGSILMRICRDRGIPADLAAFDRALDLVWADVAREDATAAYVAEEAANREWWRQVNLRTLAEAGLPASEWDPVERLFMEGVDDPLSYTVFPDSTPTLAALRAAGYRLGLVSNWGWNLPELCEAWGLASQVDFIITSARVGCAKPNPRIFQAALRQAGAAASGLLHIGDSHYADVGGARAAGADAVLVSRDGASPPDECRVVTDLRQLLPMLGLSPSEPDHA